MILTKAILAQQVIRRVSGGDQSSDSSLDRREVIKMLVEVLNRKVKENFFESYKFGDPGIDGQYIGRFGNIAVTKDPDTNEYYSTLPSSYVALPNGRGIIQISSMKNQRDVFVINKSGGKGIFSNLPAGNLEGRIGVYPESNKLWYDKDMSKSGNVLVKLVVAGPDSIGENDPLPIDTSAAESVVKEVIMFFQEQAPQDKINNNNPNA